MADYLTTDSELTSIADELRTACGVDLPLEYTTDYIMAIKSLGGSIFTGNIIRFFSKYVKPLEMIKINLAPKQDFNGYEAPWPPGGRKNLCPVAEDSRNPFTLWGAVQNDIKSAINSLAAGTYTITIKYKIVELPESNSVGYGVYATKSSGTLIGYSVSTDNSPTVGKVYTVSKTFTLAEADVGTVTNFYLYCDNSSTHSGTTGRGLYNAYDFQIESGSTATDFVPYSNICPISGHTGSTVTINGKNLLNLKVSEAVISGWNVSFPFTIKPGTYILSCQQQFGGTTNKGASVALADSNGGVLLTFSGYQFGDTSFVGVSRVVTEEIAEATTAIVFRCTESIDSTEVESIIDAEVQLERGNTATEYEAYSGTTVSISFGQTVYSGTLTVNEDGSGQVVANMAAVDLGTLNWGYITSGNIPSFRTTAEVGDMYPPASTLVKAPALCSNYPISTWSRQLDGGGTDKCLAIGWGGHTYVSITDTGYTDAATFKIAMSGVQLAYELATPLTFTVTASQINTIVGENYVWADSDDIEVQIHGDSDPLPEEVTAMTAAQILIAVQAGWA